LSLFLAIIFLINGEPGIIDGYYPLPQATMEECIVSRDFAIDYLALGEAEILAVICGTHQEIQEIITTYRNSEPV